MSAGTLLEAVARARDAKHHADQAFRAALRQARRSHSWAEIAAVARMSRGGIQWLVNHDRKEKP